MNTQGTGVYTDMAHDVGNAILFLVVSFILLWFGGYYMLGAGVDTTLFGYTRIDTYDSSVPLGMGVELVALPIAAIAAAWLRWGEEAIAVARTSGIGPLLPLLGAATLFGVFWYLDWFWSNPQDLLGIDPRFGVQRWLSVALMAGVGYFGMLRFPRLTASMAGAFAGPALFAIVGYTLFPSSMRDPEGDLADWLMRTFMIGALAVAIAAILMMLRSKRVPQRPLSYALWVGALMLCLAVAGTFETSGAHPGR